MRSSPTGTATFATAIGHGTFDIATKTSATGLPFATVAKRR